MEFILREGESLSCRTCYPGGRRIEVCSEFSDWVDWAVEVLEKEAKLDKQRVNIGRGYLEKFEVSKGK